MVDVYDYDLLCNILKVSISTIGSPKPWDLQKYENDLL